MAAALESSLGSSPPPGTIHLSLLPLDVTRRIWFWHHGRARVMCKNDWFSLVDVMIGVIVEVVCSWYEITKVIVSVLIVYLVLKFIPNTETGSSFSKTIFIVSPDWVGLIFYHNYSSQAVVVREVTNNINNVMFDLITTFGVRWCGFIMTCIYWSNSLTVSKSRVASFVLFWQSLLPLLLAPSLTSSLSSSSSSPSPPPPPRSCDNLIVCSPPSL